MNKGKIALGIALLAGAGLALAYFNPWRQQAGDGAGDPGVGDAPEPVVAEGGGEQDARARVMVADMREKIGTAIGGSDLPEAEEMLGVLKGMMDACPAVEQHLARVISEGKANIAFSVRAKDAVYSSGGDSSRNIPPHVIVLPSRTEKSPADLVDAFLFESCNAQNQARYGDLNKDRQEKLHGDTMSAIEYGTLKATIEADTVLDHVKLLVQARDSEFEISYQGHRNLLAMLKTCLESQGRELEDYEAIRDDEERIVAVLDEHHEGLRDFLMATETEPEKRAALLEPILNTPHKREAVEAWDTGQLSTKDLYAYELLETWTVPSVSAMITHGIDPTLAADEETMKAINGYIKDRLDLFEKDDPIIEGVDDVDGEPRRNRTHDARVGNIIKIIADLKEMYPTLEGHDFSAVRLTPKMREVAAARRDNWIQNPPEGVKNDLRNKGTKCIEALNGALRATIGFASTMPDDLVKDTRPALRELAKWASVPAIARVRTDIEEAQDGDPPFVSQQVGTIAQEQFYSALGEVLAPYNEALADIDFDNRTPEQNLLGVTALERAVATFPEAIRPRMLTQLSLLKSVAVDLLDIFPSVGI